ncbi:MAG: hypothetical protein U0359_11970 [Byssovorax sp.]
MRGILRPVGSGGEPHGEPSLADRAARYENARDDRWDPVPEALDRAIAADDELGRAARHARRTLPDRVEARLCPILPAASIRRYFEALREVPRERFVMPEDIALSAEDTPLGLDREGLATISAPHAYLLTFALLDLREGDHLVELGTGTGYGAALGLSIVGPRGHVTSVEIDPVLAARARRVLALLGGGEPGRLTLIEGDGCRVAEEAMIALGARGGSLKVAFTFGLARAPDRLVSLLPEGAVLVAPVGRPTFWDDEGQELMRWERRGGAIQAASHGPVRYVIERH